MRGLHAYDPQCPVCNDDPEIRVLSAHKMVKNAPEPYRNPEDQSSTWYHGTDANLKTENPAPFRTADERKNLTPSDWNVYLGTHFTSHKDVAENFAVDNYGYREEARQKWHPERSKVAHAQIHMQNPIHFDSESEMNEHFDNWAKGNGHDPLTPVRARLNPKLDEHRTLIGEYQKHLRSQGHDGVIYGNEEEGPHLHPCAIAFRQTPVTIHRWEKVDPGLRWNYKASSRRGGSGLAHPSSREEMDLPSNMQRSGAVMQRIAILESDSPIKIVAHVSGNQVDILHCPFCGSGAVIGRSDGTIECGFCTSVFTVQTQPQYNGMPQSVDGQPYEWPGMPDPAGVAAPDMPEGTNLNPNTNGENDMEDPSGGPPPFQSSDPADGGDEDDEDDDDSDKPAFLKGKTDSDSSSNKSDSKKDKKKGDNPFAKKKSYRTAAGGELDEADYLAHLAIQFANNKAKVAAKVKEARKG